MAEFTFLVCSERSGSNFITNLMNGHKKICGPSPTHLFRLFGSNMDRYGCLDKADTWDQLLSDVVEGFNNILGSWSSAVTKEELADAVTTRTSAELIKYIYEKEASTDQANHLFVKENHCYSFAPYLLSNFETSRFLVFVRDPRDVVSSWVNTQTIPGGIEKAVDVWIRDQQNAVSLYSQLKGTQRCFAVRYEDVLSETEETLTKILSWMGLDYQEEVLEFHKSSRTQKNAKRIEAWNNLSSGIMHNNHSKFKELLSKEEIQYVEVMCGSLMNIFGYQTTQKYEFESEQSRQMELQRLKPFLRKGSYDLQDEEKEIREKRLKFIGSILQRQPKCIL